MNSCNLLCTHHLIDYWTWQQQQVSVSSMSWIVAPQKWSKIEQQTNILVATLGYSKQIRYQLDFHVGIFSIHDINVNNLLYFQDAHSCWHPQKAVTLLSVCCLVSNLEKSHIFKENNVANFSLADVRQSSGSPNAVIRQLSGSQQADRFLGYYSNPFFWPLIYMALQALQCIDSTSLTLPCHFDKIDSKGPSKRDQMLKVDSQFFILIQNDSNFPSTGQFSN